jgi:poly-gamma-glutamate synthesis protein (capsule biosynthesis protein)
MFVGDINLGEYYLSLGHGPRNFLEKSDVFHNVQRAFHTSDLVVGNLEAAITNCNVNYNDPESMVLRGNPEHAHFLKKSGFGILQISNNHTVQHGFDGFDETVNILNELEIEVVGLNNEKVVCIENEGIKIGFLAASDVPDNTYRDQNKYQRLNDDFISRAISEVSNYDHLIIMLHWGLESSTRPLKYQREIVEKFYNSGVRAVIGTHPHLFYEIEKRKNFISAYSLGNFIFDLCWDRRMEQSGILSLEFSKVGMIAEFWPIQIKKNGCLPTIVGNPKRIDDTLLPYDLGTMMNWQKLKKFIYFTRNILKGYTFLKFKFFVKKLVYMLKLCGSVIFKV